MSSNNSRASHFGLLRSDIPDSMIDAFISGELEDSRESVVLRTWRDIQANYPNFERAIKELSHGGPDTTPEERQETSRGLIRIFMLLQRAVITEQLEDCYNEGSPSSGLAV